MDTNLLYILIATGVISVLTLIYVIVDENLKQRRYAKVVAERKEQEELEQAKDPSPDLSLEADDETSKGSSAKEVEDPAVEVETPDLDPLPNLEHSQESEDPLPVVDHGDPESAEIAAKVPAKDQSQ